MNKRNFRRFGKRKVLVVEDVELNQFLAKCIMESWSFEVEIACNGREALKMLETNLYDIILMDIQMPEMDGIESARRIRLLEDQVKSAIPIIALTANTMQADLDLYMQAGMNDCLAKPFVEQSLFDIIRKHLKEENDIEGNGIEENSGPIASGDKLYDMSLVNSLSGGDEDFVNRMVMLFLETMPVSMNEIRAACENNDWETVGKMAHKMKSTIDSMAILRVKELIRVLENNGKNRQNIELIPLQVQLLLQEMELCISKVRKDFGM